LLPLSQAQSQVETRAAVRTAAWGLVLYTATRLIGMVAASTSMAAAVAQAVAAEYGAGRLGVAWSDPLQPLPNAGQMARRASIGAALGAGAAAVLALLAFATRAAIFDKPESTSWSIIAVGLVTAALTAMRDELLLHGVTLRALSSVEAAIPRALACGVTSAAASLGEPTTTPILAGAHFLLGTAFGSLWVRDRGAWMPWGAHFAFLFVTGTILGGGAFQMRNAMNAWGGSEAGILGGTVALVALGPVALFALGRIRGLVRGEGRPNSPESKDPG
jgi:hypothetical protein